MTNDYIRLCTNSNSQSLCPVFSLDYILSNAEPDLNERYQMLLKVTFKSYLFIISKVTCKNFCLF